MLVLSSGLWLFSAAMGGWFLPRLINALLSGGDLDIPVLECVFMAWNFMGIFEFRITDFIIILRCNLNVPSAKIAKDLTIMFSKMD